MLVAEAFYSRAWLSEREAVDAIVVVAAEAVARRVAATVVRHLESMRDSLVSIEHNVAVLGDDTVQEELRDRARKHFDEKYEAAFSTPGQKLLGALVGEAKRKSGLGEKLLDELLNAGKALVHERDRSAKEELQRAAQRALGDGEERDDDR